MIEVYELTHRLSVMYPLALKLLLYFIAFAFVVYSFPYILLRMKPSDFSKSMKQLFSTIVLIFGALTLASLTVAFVALKTSGAPIQLSKDQYSLEIVDNHIRLHLIEGKSLSMEVEHDNHTYHVSSLEIMEEKSDHYLCRVEEKNSSSIVKIMKNDYKFENTRRS